VPRQHYAALVIQADAFFDRVAGQVGTRMQCASGCSSCCADELTITAVEAEVIREHLAARETAIEVNRSGGCAALDVGGRCQIYEARPLLCRTHGVPIKIPGHLPVVSSCELNFAATGALEAVPTDCRLDQQTLVAKLWAIDAAWSDSRHLDRNRRVAIRELLENS
jgi:hypothetical protein